MGSTSNDTRLQIGRAHTWNGFYDGLLGQVSLFGRALTASEVAQQYCAGLARYGGEPIPSIPLR